MGAPPALWQPAGEQGGSSCTPAPWSLSGSSCRPAPWPTASPSQQVTRDGGSTQQPVAGCRHVAYFPQLFFSRVFITLQSFCLFFKSFYFTLEFQDLTVFCRYLKVFCNNTVQFMTFLFNLFLQVFFILNASL